MRARPAQIMAALREEGDLSVREAWIAYRQVRDSLAERDEKPSYAALERHPRIVYAAIRAVGFPEEPLDEDAGDFWELTIEYEG